MLALNLIAPAIIVAQRSDATPSPETSPGLAYDVVAIRPSRTTNSGKWRIDWSGDRLMVQNATVKELVAEAYSVREDQISGEFRRLDSTRYDIQGKILDVDPEALKNVNDRQRRSMLQVLLARRFKLKAHFETQTKPVYDMVVNGKGIKFKEAAKGSNSDVNNEPTGFQGMKPQSLSLHSAGATSEILAHAVTMKQFAFVLSTQVGRTVVDMTDLPGYYDVELSWGSTLSPEASSGTGAIADSAGPSIFTALVDQLGLKLKAAKGPVQALIVDQLQTPTEN